MYKILFQQNNNKLGIIYPASSEFLNDSIKSLLKNNTPYKIVEDLNIDDIFFDAYDFDQELGAKINTEKAKEIQKNRFRQARKPILEKLDVEFMRALEVGDTQKQQEIAAKKQALRDVTNTSLPNDLEGIKNTWPNVLNS